MGKFENRDCMEGMAEYPDNYFELAIVDPVYMDRFSVGSWFDCKAKNKKYKNKTECVSIKTKECYFDLLFKKSKNQIIWGGNYFKLPLSRGWIVWDKLNGDNNFSDCELAWSSFDRILKKFAFRWQGMLQKNMKEKEVRIHPTQKPIELYRWLLKNYAKAGDKILDTHVGSASSLIACIDMGFDYVGFELDKYYYNAACNRIKNHTDQLKLC